jgi:hypothetical protein
MANRTGDFYPAADDAIHGYGCELQVGNGGSPETFESVAFIREITPGDMSTADLDCTHLRSPDAHREHRAGIRDSAAWSGSGVYVPTEESLSNAGGGSGSFTTGGLPAIWRGRQNHNFKVVFAEASPNNEIEIRGYISQFQIGTIGIDDIVPFNFSFQPSQAFDANMA